MYQIEYGEFYQIVLDQALFLELRKYNTIGNQSFQHWPSHSPEEAREVWDKYTDALKSVGPGVKASDDEVRQWLITMVKNIVAIAEFVKGEQHVT